MYPRKAGNRTRSRLAGQLEPRVADRHRREKSSAMSDILEFPHLIGGAQER